MTNQRGWKDGVYNPGFPPNKAYIERKAKEFATGFEWPEIKGVQFKRAKNQHKPMRNVVTRVVMVGFDPFNHSGLPEHIERKVVYDYYTRLEREFVESWVGEAVTGEIRAGFIIGDAPTSFFECSAELSVRSDEHSVTRGYLIDDPKEGEEVPHNPMLTVRENMQLDQIRARKDSDPVISEIGLLTGVIPGDYHELQSGTVHHAIELNNGKLYARGSMDRFHHTMCPEVEVKAQTVFQHAGHLWLHTHSNWATPGITGTVELYVPTAEDLVPTPVDVGRISHFSQFADIAKQTSQCVRNETMAICLEGLDVADAYLPHFMVPEDLTPEEIQDREQAVQEAAEGKLDYLLEGTQHDPRNRK